MNDGILSTCILQSCSFQFVQSFIVEVAFLEERHHVLALGVATFGAAMFALYANVSRLFSCTGVGDKFHFKEHPYMEGTRETSGMLWHGN